MYFSKILAIVIYILVLLGVALLSYRKHQSSSDYIIGGRSLNFWLTALAAHASDMSSWLLMAYPAVIFTQGLFQGWVGIGLIIFMYFNWKWIAPKVREATEKYNSMTLSSFFESRYHDTSGLIRVITALMLFVFYTIYISAGLIGLGLLVESLFNCNYYLGITIGICVVIPYLFIGGYVTLAWTDLFQGLFLMAVCIFVPFYVIYHNLGSFDAISFAAHKKQISLSLIPNFKPQTFLQIFLVIAGWGLGYFGQPHIITKFMGIKKVTEMKKAMYVGMSWQIITISCATLIGLVGIAYHPHILTNPQLVFVSMVEAIFTPMIATFILCAIFAATISTMDSQILVLISSLAEDFYKRVFHKNASSQTILLVSRISIFIVSALAYCIAFTKFSTIFSLVSYAWSGLGATFGPVLILGLFTKTANKYGAWAGISSGGVIAGVWPYFNQLFKSDIPSIIPGFFISLFSIWIVSLLTRKKHLRSLEQDIQRKQLPI
jgi:sodium/proline symporter